MASFAGLGVAVDSEVATSKSVGFQTLTDFMGKGRANVGDDLIVLLTHLQYACKRISALVASPFNSELGKQMGHGGGVDSFGGRDAPKPLDLVSVLFLSLN